MGDGYNRWTGLGNLTGDADLRYTQGGQAICKFTVACNESYKDRDGARKERCEFVNCCLFGKRGEAIAKYLTKGTALMVEGSLRTSSWEKDGQKRYKTEVNVTNVIFAGGKGGGGGGYGGGQREPETESYGPAPDAGGFDDDSDIPFT